MTSHSCSHNACTVSMRTAHRRTRRRGRPSAAVAAVGISLAVLAGAWLVGSGLGGLG